MIRNATDYEEKVSLLASYKDAEKHLIEGEAQAYKIGSREFTALDLGWITRRIRELENEIDVYLGNKKKARGWQVAFRDW